MLAFICFGIKHSLRNIKASIKLSTSLNVLFIYLYMYVFERNGQGRVFYVMLNKPTDYSDGL